MNLGNKLTELRKNNNLSQEELANKMQVSRQSISLWENNQSKPSTEKLIELAKFFNVSLDSLISENPIDYSNDIIAKTVHTKETYQTLVNETTNFFQRHLVRIVLLIIIPLIVLAIRGITFPEYLIFLVLYILIFVPIIIYGSIFLETKKITKTLNFNLNNIQIFVFKKDELLITYDDNLSKNESKVKYEAFKNVLVSDNYLYLEHPAKKRNYFQIDLNNFVRGNKKMLKDFLSNKYLEIKKIKSKDILNKPQASNILKANKKLYYILIGLLLVALTIFILILTTLNKKNAELNSYYSSRESLNDFMIYSLFIIPLLGTLIYSIVLSKQKYKSKLIIVSYIVIPIIMIGVLLMTVIMPFTQKNKYFKDYSIVQNIFDQAGIYLPSEGLSISVKHFNVNDDNITTIPYALTHKILIEKDLNNFEQSLSSNIYWVTQKTQSMKTKLNLFIDKDADYYLIYNKTADNYNSDELAVGLNKLFVFYYFFETNEVLIYEFYLNGD